MNYSGIKFDLIYFLSKLINCKSESPSGDEAIDFLVSHLQPMGFECHKLKFDDITTNLYARYGIKAPNLCFAGHVDVVPAGNGWDTDPYKASINNGGIYGRGAVDMKGAIASFIGALADIDLRKIDGSLSLLISGNEEGDATYGTPMVLKWLE